MRRGAAFDFAVGRQRDRLRRRGQAARLSRGRETVDRLLADQRVDAGFQVEVEQFARRFVAGRAS